MKMNASTFWLLKLVYEMIYLAFSYQHCWRFYFNKYRAISVWIKLNLSTVLLSTEFLSKDDCFNVQLQSIRNLWSIAKSYLIPLIWKTNKGVLSIRSTCTGLRPEINSLTFFSLKEPNGSLLRRVERLGTIVPVSIFVLTGISCFSLFSFFIHDRK